MPRSRSEPRVLTKAVTVNTPDWLVIVLWGAGPGPGLSAALLVRAGDSRLEVQVKCPSPNPQCAG